MVLFFSVRRENEFRIEPVRGRSFSGPNGFCYDEGARAGRAGSVCPIRMSNLRIERELTRWTTDVPGGICGPKDTTAPWATNLNLGLAIRICVAGENAGRKQVHQAGTFWAGCLLNPEIIEYVANLPSCVQRFIERANPFAYCAGQLCEVLMQLLFINLTQGNAPEEG